MQTLSHVRSVNIGKINATGTNLFASHTVLPIIPAYSHPLLLVQLDMPAYSLATCITLITACLLVTQKSK